MSKPDRLFVRALAALCLVLASPAVAAGPLVDAPAGNWAT